MHKIYFLWSSREHFLSKLNIALKRRSSKIMLIYKPKCIFKQFKTDHKRKTFGIKCTSCGTSNPKRKMKWNKDKIYFSINTGKHAIFLFIEIKRRMPNT